MSALANADSDDELISIGRLAAETGVSSRTIRYYEELGILPKPPRSPGGTRKYPREYRFYIEGALALKELGFTLDEIRLLGRMALGRPMSQKQRAEAAAIVAGHMGALEHKIRVLSRLRDVLNEYGSRGRGEPEAHVSELVSFLAERRS
jgi:DNA-binding transcriptional MerR regulator